MKRINIDNALKKKIIKIGEILQEQNKKIEGMLTGNIRLKSILDIKELDKKIDIIKNFDGAVDNYDDGGIIVDTTNTSSSTNGRRSDAHSIVSIMKSYLKLEEKKEKKLENIPIDNIKFSDMNSLELCNVKVLGESNFLNLFSNLKIVNSFFDKITVTRNNIEILENSTINKIIFYPVKDNYRKIIIKKSNIKNIDNKIKELDTFGYIYFDEKSNIINNSREVYSELKRRSDSQIQKHIFYVKELEAYREEIRVNVKINWYNPKTWFKSDDDFLIWINDKMNRNGLSIIIPILWLFNINLIIVLIMYIFGNPNIDFLWNILSLSPFNSITNSLAVEDKIWLNAVDNFRRVALSIFYYLIISSALRFKFKK